MDIGIKVKVLNSQGPQTLNLHRGCLKTTIHENELNAFLKIAYNNSIPIVTFVPM
jgi:hypothetical protein